MDNMLAGDPQAIVQLVSDQEARKVQAAIQVRYGFKPTLTYAADLAAFVLSLTQAHGEEVADESRE